MNYFVRTILTVQFHDGDKVKEHTSFKYQPTFNRTDAEHMAEMLNKCVHHHQSGGKRIRRNFDVCAGIWNGKENIYLDVATLEQIADEYTRPALAAE